MNRDSHFHDSASYTATTAAGLILPTQPASDVKATPHGPLEVVSRKDRREVLKALGTLHKLFQTTAIRFPESELKDRQRAEVESLARKLLGDDVAFEVLT